uniref:Uncharacterized protein n=1 Tax=Cucumis sativus TaxID=3659 RepID=A0A0A0KSC0_CUCSA
MSMDLISGFFSSILGTITVRTPFSMLAFTSSTLAFSGSLNLLMNFPQLRSILCHLSFFSSCSLLLSPLICKTLPSSTSTLTSSFLIPGRSALKMWACGVSFQSMRVLAKAEVSRAEEGALAKEFEKGKPSKGSQMSNEKGSKTLLRRPPKMLGTRAMVVEFEVGRSRLDRKRVFCRSGNYLVG